MTAKERSIRSDLNKVDAYVLKPEDYEDAPELTEDQLADAIVSRPGRRGRPPISNPKLPIKLRLDPDLVASLKATGPGWQTRINDALRAMLSLTEGSRSNPVRSVRRAAGKKSLKTGPTKRGGDRKRA